METTIQNYNYPEKTRALLVVVHTYQSFPPGNVRIKNSTILTMLTPYLRIRALAKRAEFIPLPNDEISDEIPRFASVQSNSIA